MKIFKKNNSFKVKTKNNLNQVLIKIIMNRMIKCNLYKETEWSQQF
jgi:hypothetical protein